MTITKEIRRALTEAAHGQTNRLYDLLHDLAKTRGIAYIDLLIIAQRRLGIDFEVGRRTLDLLYAN